MQVCDVRNGMCGVCGWLRQSLAELAKKAGLDLNEHKISSGKAMAAATA
jgi:branched-subunit amino acid aminotransferase/4-amino-4-deoxychorismate lyase